jgi:transposase
MWVSDYRIFASFPAAAEVFAPRLLAAFGEDRSRFKSAQAMQCYGGVAPVTKRSGNEHKVRWRFCSTTFVRQTLVEWSAQTIPRSYWAGEFYKRHRERGGTHQGALRALAFKWVRKQHSGHRFTVIQHGAAAPKSRSTQLARTR